MTDLHDLLDRRARQGSIHPSMEGIHDAVDRRRDRRRRRRTIGGGIAAVCLLAAAAGLALSSGDDTTEHPMVSPGLPEVPTVGLELEGFEQHEPRIGEFALGDDPPRSAAIFRSGESITDPFAIVSVQPPIDGAPAELPWPPDTDLDGDGRPDAIHAGTDAGWVLSWHLADGSLASFASKATDSQPRRWRTGYARQIYGPTLDLEAIPAPEGLPERQVVTLPDPRGPVQAEVTYESDGGARQITVRTTNQPGWLHLAYDGVLYPVGGPGYEELALGPSFLGAGRAMVLPPDWVPDDHDAYAVVETVSGLTLEISTFGVGPEVLTQLIQDGSFVDLDSDGPVTTDPTPTTAAPTSTPGLPSASIVDVRLGSHDGYDRVVVEFADRLPDTRDVTLSDRPASGECVAPELDAFTFVNLHLGLTSSGRDANEVAPYGTGDGPVLSVDRTCEFEAFVEIVISVDRPVQPIATELSSPPRLVVDLVPEER